jgi:Mg2+-importing ATPase
MQYQKVDEIPFDYERRRMSVVIKDGQGNHRIITKGALESILKICTTVKDEGAVVPACDDLIKKINSHAESLNNDGMNVIAIAEKKEYAGINVFSKQDESGMTFIGYVAFLDPPRPDVAQTLKDIYAAGIEIKVLTGDSPLVAQRICKLVGMKSEGLISGPDIENMPDEELKTAAKKNNIFARLAPMQKQRVVMALRSSGNVVGYMGDGVNDAPSLRNADVGISVDSATDIAKESSDIILLEKSLSVLKEGIYEGRRIYGNIMKYMKMALSSNFGNVFSVLVASIFLPFLPMMPIQILIQNLIYDISQITIPWDNVDPEFIVSPKRWDMRGLSRFMNTLGITSSIFDVATFLSLWFILGYNNPDKQIFFQTGWFIEGLISQTLIVHFIRTSRIPFIQSRADGRLIFSTLGCMGLALIIPLLLQSVAAFHFTVMPSEYYLFLAIILISYAVLVEIIKRIYIRIYKEWL